MARSYGRVLSTVWSDPDWVALSQGAQHLYVLLLSQPKLTLVGLLDYLPSRWARLAADTSLASVEAAIDELEASRFVLVDHDTDELLIRTFVRHDIHTIRANANLVKGMWAAWATIQSPKLREAVVDAMPEDLWKTPRCQPHPEAQRIRRSDRLEPTVLTNGSDQRSEPPEAWNLDPALAASTHTDPPPAGQRSAAAQDIFDQALDLLTSRELDRNPTRNGNAERHARAVKQGKRKDHQAAASKLLHKRPDLEPDDLANLLEPVLTGVGATGQRPSPLDSQQAAARAAAERHLRVARGEACQACADTGFTLDEDGNAVPCEHQETPA